MQQIFYLILKAFHAQNILPECLLTSIAFFWQCFVFLKRVCIHNSEGMKHPVWQYQQVRKHVFGSNTAHSGKSTWPMWDHLGNSTYVYSGFRTVLNNYVLGRFCARSNTIGDQRFCCSWCIKIYSIRLTPLMYTYMYVYIHICTYTYTSVESPANLYFCYENYGLLDRIPNMFYINFKTKSLTATRVHAGIPSCQWYSGLLTATGLMGYLAVTCSAWKWLPGDLLRKSRRRTYTPTTNSLTRLPPRTRSRL